MIRFKSLLIENEIDEFQEFIERKFNTKYPSPESGSKADMNGFQITLTKYSDNIIQLSGIYVPKIYRGKGIGTEIMNMLINYADSNNKTIILTPSKDFGATSINRLVKFYKRFGFIKNLGRNKDFSFKDTMYRLPKK